MAVGVFAASWARICFVHVCKKGKHRITSFSRITPEIGSGERHVNLTMELHVLEPIQTGTGATNGDVSIGFMCNMHN